MTMISDQRTSKRPPFSDAEQLELGADETQPLIEAQQSGQQLSFPDVKDKVQPQDSRTFTRKLPFIGKIIDLYDKYDTTFLNLLAMQYFNQGSKVLVSLATQDLFKAYYHLSPSQV